MKIVRTTKTLVLIVKIFRKTIVFPLRTYAE